MKVRSSHFNPPLPTPWNASSLKCGSQFGARSRSMSQARDTPRLKMGPLFSLYTQSSSGYRLQLRAGLQREVVDSMVVLLVLETPVDGDILRRLT